MVSMALRSSAQSSHAAQEVASLGRQLQLVETGDLRLDNKVDFHRHGIYNKQSCIYIYILYIYIVYLYVYIYIVYLYLYIYIYYLFILIIFMFIFYICILFILIFIIFLCLSTFIYIYIYIFFCDLGVFQTNMWNSFWSDFHQMSYVSSSLQTYRYI